MEKCGKFVVYSPQIFAFLAWKIKIIGGQK
jgi:hypothetical protein